MEVREVVDTPIDLQLLLRDGFLAEPWGKGVCAEDDHVKPTGRSVIHPFGGKEADGL